MINLLSLDGGGVRGIMSAVVLEELQNLTQKPLVELFQYQIATSTGSLIQAGTNLPHHQFTYKQIVELYKDKSRDIFHRTLWNKITNPDGLFEAEFSVALLDKTLKEDYGDTTLDELTCKKIHFTSFNVQKRSFTTFNNATDPKMFLRSTVRACIAAPTYFTSPDYFTDGALGANNPSLLGYSFIVRDGGTPQNTTVVSIGTGKVKTGIDIGESGLIKVAPVLPDLFIGGEMGATELAMGNMLGKNYHRIQFSITQSEDSMDNTSEENLQTLEKIAETYVDDHKEELKKIAKKISSEYIEISFLIPQLPSNLILIIYVIKYLININI